MKSFLAIAITALIIFMDPISAFAQSAAASASPMPSPASSVSIGQAVLSPAIVVAPIDPNSAVALIPTLVSFLKSGGYLAASAVIVLLLCFVFNQYIAPKLGLGSALTPILSTILGAIGGPALAIANGGSLQSAVLAVMAGPAATHLWELAFNYFFAKAATPAASAAAVAQVIAAAQPPKAS